MSPVVWTSARAPELAALVADALPGEGLSVDDLLGVCWDDPGLVLSAGDGAAACAAVVRRVGDWTGGFVRLLVVHPGARRQGLGRALVVEAEDWLRSEGATQVRFGGSAPFYLWPGIDTAWTAGLCLAEACGYRTEGAELDLSCPTTMRVRPPEGVDVRRLSDDADIAAMAAWCDASWPHWNAELARACEQSTAIGVFGADGEALGFACHSVNRAGWVGPMATRPRRSAGAHVPGTGAALLSVVCRDLMAAGYSDAHIAWVSNVSFYARAAGATVSRVYRTVVKDLR
jgi:GNAT superfamily N-acetyltransferase